MLKPLMTTFALAYMLFSSFASAGLVKGLTLTVDNVERSYDMYVPSPAIGDPKPLVLLLHGHFGSSDVMTGENKRPAPYKLWLPIAERQGWYLVIPNGAYGSDKRRGWNDCRADAQTNPATDDVNFLNLLVDTVSTKYPVEQTRIYAHGTSNGGNMAFRLALEGGGKYRAIAAVVAAMPEKNLCHNAKHPISVLVMNGTDDSILPFFGGRVGNHKSDRFKRGSVISAQETVGFWLNHNNIATPPVITHYPNINKRDKSTVQSSLYKNNDNGSEVVFYQINGGGHTEPSLTQHHRRLYKRIVGEQNRDIEMVTEVWKFFHRN